MTPTLLARFLRDTLSISLKCAKRRGGRKNKSCLRASRPITNPRKSSNHPGFRVSPPTSLNFGRGLPPLYKIFLSSYPPKEGGYQAFS